MSYRVAEGWVVYAGMIKSPCYPNPFSYIMNLLNVSEIGGFILGDFSAISAYHH